MRVPPTIAQQVEAALQGLRYGSVQLIIHDAKVVRIERVERIRLTDASEALTDTSGRPTTSLEVRHVAHKEA